MLIRTNTLSQSHHVIMCLW